MAEEKKITHSYLIFVVNPKVTRLSLPATLTIMGLNSSKQGLCLTSYRQVALRALITPNSLTWDPTPTLHM